MIATVGRFPAVSVVDSLQYQYDVAVWWDVFQRKPKGETNIGEVAPRDTANTYTCEIKERARYAAQDWKEAGVASRVSLLDIIARPQLKQDLAAVQDVL